MSYGECQTHVEVCSRNPEHIPNCNICAVPAVPGEHDCSEFVSTLQDELSQLRERNESLAQEVHAITYERGDLIEQRARLNRRFENLLTERGDDAREFREQIQRLTNRVEELITANTNLLQGVNASEAAVQQQRVHELSRELETVRRERDDALTSRQRRIDQLVHDLEVMTEQANRQGQRGYANNIRVRGEWRDHPVLTVYHNGVYHRFGHQVNDRIHLNMRAADLRTQIEERFGRRLGSIVRLDYTVLGVHETLRQHQIGHRPTFWIALPENQELIDGQVVRVIVGRGGAII